jgi:putative hydrolases of HD superfamily
MAQDAMVGDSPRDTGMVRFLHVAGRLKRVRRTGWLDRGIPPEQCESVADHTFRVTLLAWLASLDPQTGLDPGRVMRLALAHDLAEALAGDVPPYDPDALAAMPSGERAAFLDQRHERAKDRTASKREAERAAFARMIAGLTGPVREELESLWQELDARSTPEARFVKEADRIETYLQSREYAAAFPGLPVASFAAEVASTIEHPVMVEIRDAIAAEGFHPGRHDPDGD